MAKSILIVGDEPARAFAKSVLQPEGYRIFEAASSLEALLFCVMGASPIELLLTQIEMPGIGGRALGQKVSERFPAVPVLYLREQADALRQEVRSALEPARKPAASEVGPAAKRQSA
jgi:CheY-like chemotaxis protein